MSSKVSARSWKLDFLCDTVAYCQTARECMCYRTYPGLSTSSHGRGTCSRRYALDRTKRVKDARSEAQKEIEEYRSEKDEEFKAYEKEVRCSTPGSKSHALKIVDPY